MSDVLIAQEVGTVVVIETAPAEIVEVVAVGPQGPVGDVNPQMPVILAATEAARDAALASEQAASASQSAAATSAANAATSESNAATSAATATAQATASADSATASAGSAAAAQASATNAATSETNAANSATASANSATSSANSATAAQAAQTATESARDTTLATIGTAALKANNLSDLANAATARSNLGLGNVNNTSDANKPVSTATQAALDTKAPLSHVGATGAAHGVVTTSVAGFMSAADKTKLDGVAESANNYTHPSGDGNLHVPATGTTNSGKVLKAGDTAGSLSWGTLAKADVGLGSVDNTADSAKPISTATQTALNAKQDSITAVTKDSATGMANIPAGTSAQRPASPPFGAQRANSTIGAMEWWNGTAWAPIGGDDTAGHIAYFARTSAPTGYLKANGALVSRTTYAALFAAIGTTFGAGDGATTFKLPDLRGEFIRGFDDGRGIDTGRAIGTAQEDVIKTTNASSQFLIGKSISGGYGYGASGITPGLQSMAPSWGTPQVGTGSETRPRNVALLACIKF